MPTPTEAYTNSVQRQGYSGARLRPADFGSAGEMIARAGANVGAALGQTADSLVAIQKDDAKTLAQEADNLRTEQRLNYLYGEDGFFTKQGKAAMDAAQRLPGDLKKIDEDVAGQLLKGNGYARKLFDEVTLRRNEDTMPKIFGHVATQRKIHQDAVDEAGIDTAIDTATLSQDPKIIEENIATVGNLAVNKMIRSGEYDNGVLEHARQAAIGKAVGAIAQHMEVKSPSEAQAFVTSHASLMDPQDVATLLSALAPKAAQEDAWGEADNVIAAVSGEPPADGKFYPEGGNGSPTPIPNEAALDAAQFTGAHAVEGAAAHTDKNGNLIRSPAGALGIAQIMPANLGPKGFGYGVVPPRDNSRAEFLRAGKEYRAALLKKYDGNIVLALTAYNAGPGNVDAHIKAVGDPRKGEISDVAFVNSMPKKEQREYAAKILQQTGVKISGAAGGVKAVDAYGGQEFDLDAAIDYVQKDPNKTFVQKQALISALKEKHTLGEQKRVDTERAIVDDVWTEINKLGDNFTSYEQLPLNLRTQLATMPEKVAAFTNLAQGNARAAAAAAKDVQDEQIAQTEQSLYELEWSDPNAFSRIDFRTDKRFAGMGTVKITEWMKKQEEVRKQQSGQGGNVNYDTVRSTLSRFLGPVSKDSPRAGRLYEIAKQRVEARARASGKPLTDADYEGVIADMMQPVTVEGARRGLFKGEVQAGLKPGEHVTVQVNKYEQARNELRRRYGREPLPQEVDAAVRAAYGG